MGQARVLQQFRRFISLNAVLEYSDAYIAFLKKNDPEELGKFEKALEEFKETPMKRFVNWRGDVGVPVEMDYARFLERQPRFREFIQRQITDRYAKRLAALLEGQVSESQIQQEYKEFLGKAHENLEFDFLDFCQAQYFSKQELKLDVNELDSFKKEYRSDLHREYELEDLREGHCFGFSITDALLKSWEDWEERIKNWSGKYTDLQSSGLPEAKMGDAPQDLRGILSCAIPYVVTSQASKDSRGYGEYRPDGLTQSSFLKPELHVITKPRSKKLPLPEEKIRRSYFEISVFNPETKQFEIRSVQKHRKISGNFGETLPVLLDEKLITGNICLIGPLNHACHISCENGTWTFYDPNKDKRVRGTKEEVAQAAIGTLGPFLDIEVASFDAKQELDFSKYDEILENSPELVLKSDGLNHIIRNSPDTLIELFKRARTNEKLFMAIANVLTNKDVFERTSFYLIMGNEQARDEFLKLIPINPHLGKQVAQALAWLTHSKNDFIRLAEFISANIDQLKVGFHLWPQVIIELSAFATKFKKDLSVEQYEKITNVCASYRGVYAKHLCETISNIFNRDSPYQTNSLLLAAENVVSFIDQVKVCLPQHPPAIFQLVRLAHSMEKEPESKAIMKVVINIIRTQETFSELIKNSKDDPSFIDELFKLAKENVGIRKALHDVFIGHVATLRAKGLFDFFGREDKSLVSLFKLAGEDKEFAVSLKNVLLMDGKEGLKLVINDSRVRDLIQFAQQLQDPDFNAALASALSTVKEGTQTTPLHDIIQLQISGGEGAGLSELFKLAESKEGNAIRQPLFDALTTPDSSGKTGMDYLLSGAREQYPDLLRFIYSQNQPALYFAFYQSVSKLQDNGILFVDQLSKEDSMRAGKLFAFVASNARLNGMPCESFVEKFYIQFQTMTPEMQKDILRDLFKLNPAILLMLSEKAEFSQYILKAAQTDVEMRAHLEYIFAYAPKNILAVQDGLSTMLDLAIDTTTPHQLVQALCYVLQLQTFQLTPNGRLVSNFEMIMSDLSRSKKIEAFFSLAESKQSENFVAALANAFNSTALGIHHIFYFLSTMQTMEVPVRLFRLGEKHTQLGESITAALVRVNPAAGWNGFDYFLYPDVKMIIDLLSFVVSQKNETLQAALNSAFVGSFRKKMESPGGVEQLIKFFTELSSNSRKDEFVSLVKKIPELESLISTNSSLYPLYNRLLADKDASPRLFSPAIVVEGSSKTTTVAPTNSVADPSETGKTTASVSRRESKH